MLHLSNYPSDQSRVCSPRISHLKDIEASKANRTYCSPLSGRAKNQTWMRAKLARRAGKDVENPSRISHRTWYEEVAVPKRKDAGKSLRRTAAEAHGRRSSSQQAPASTGRHASHRAISQAGRGMAPWFAGGVQRRWARSTTGTERLETHSHTRVTGSRPGAR
jgi:hypothetical protein